MKKFYIAIIFVIAPVFIYAQQLYRLKFEDYQKTSSNSDNMVKEVNLPFKDTIVMVGGLNDLDGMGNYINVYGSKLIIDSQDVTANGIKRVVLRREDGLDFYNLYPTINAQLVPVTFE